MVPHQLVTQRNRKGSNVMKTIRTIKAALVGAIPTVFVAAQIGLVL